MFDGPSRDHVSYLVSVKIGKTDEAKKGLYWPRVSQLESANKIVTVVILKAGVVDLDGIVFTPESLAEAAEKDDHLTYNEETRELFYSGTMEETEGLFNLETRSYIVREE
jgi:hypothetical protein